MRTKRCKLICRLPCLAVEPVELILGGPQSIQVGGRRIIVSVSALDVFAAFDGFKNFADMIAFWRQEHGEVVTFSGWHIRWLPLPEDLHA